MLSKKKNSPRSRAVVTFVCVCLCLIGIAAENPVGARDRTESDSYFSEPLSSNDKIGAAAQAGAPSQTLYLPAIVSSIPEGCENCSRLMQLRSLPDRFPAPINRDQQQFYAHVSPLFRKDADNFLNARVTGHEQDSNGFDELDVFRLENYKLSAWDALLEIYQHNPGDENLEDIVGILRSRPVQVSRRDILGRWKCKTHKLGGIGENITSYSFFDCRIFRKGKAYYFQKVSGSQRVIGPLFPGDKYFTLRGCGYYAYSNPCTYLGGKTNFKDRKSEYDEVGVLLFSGKNQGALLFPSPFFESKFDILELQR
jgi:hypothetical protein